MAGLLGQQAAGAAPPEEAVPQEAQQEAQADPTQQQAGGTPQPEEPTPEEQKEFTQIEIGAKRVIHEDPKRFNKFATRLKSGTDDLVNTLADTALMLFGIVESSSKKGISDTVFIRAAEVCLDLIIKLADDIGLQTDEAMAEEALKILTEQLIQDYNIQDEEGAAAQEAGPDMEEAPAEEAAPAEPVPAEGEAPPQGVM